MNTKTPPDFEPYSPENVPLFEALYGPDLISLGGTTAIEAMFSDLNLEGLNVLDIGFGLGGMAFYLAKHYKTKVSGVEIHPWMVAHARTHAPKELASFFNFETYDANGKLPFESKHFDIVYSKGVLNHVHDKGPLFREIYSVLKPKGLFVIADWIVPEASKETHPILATETQTSYERTLLDAGFDQCTFRDDSSLFLGYVNDFITNLNQKRAFIEQKYSPELFSIIAKQHDELHEAIKHKHKQAVRIVARRPL